MTTMKDRFEHPTQAVDVMMHSRSIKRNQCAIESLLKGSPYLWQARPGFLWYDYIDWSPPNEGNFVQVVRFRAETDHVLPSHLKESPKPLRSTVTGLGNGK